MRTNHALLLALLLGACWPAAAQWVWMEGKDRKVYSDRPPPAGIAESDILQRPKAANLRPAAAPAAAGATSAASGAAAPRLSGTDKELQDRKNQAQDQEAAKKKAEQEAQARARADNCARARQAKANYDSGVRLARTNAQGEREIMDDAARASETQRLQNIIASDCG
jgi:type IV secretory pathway VirB10-like protein